MKLLAKSSLLLVLLMILMATPMAVTAQNNTVNNLTPAAEAYLDALPRQIETDVLYLLPNAPAPDLSNQAPEPESEFERTTDGGQADVSVTTGRGITMLIVAVLLTAVIYLFARYGGSFAISMKGDVEDRPMTIRAKAIAAFGSNSTALSLFDIRDMTDKSLALVALTQKTLAQVVEKQDILFQDSWTLRDALQSLPSEMQYRVALRHLVMTSERVLFGDHEITEPEFKSHYDAVLPLLQGAAHE